MEGETRRQRPLSVTLIGWLFVAAGTVGVVYHATEVRVPVDVDVVWVLFVRLLAIAGGVLTLRGDNLGRWLVLAWMAYHVVLSVWQSVSQTLTHAVVLAVIAFLLLRAPAAAYFRGREGQSGQPAA